MGHEQESVKLFGDFAFLVIFDELCFSSDFYELCAHEQESDELLLSSYF